MDFWKIMCGNWKMSKHDRIKIITDGQQQKLTFLGIPTETFLQQVNEANGQIIPYDGFYIPELADKVDISTHYVMWINQRLRVGILNAVTVLNWK